MDVLFLILAVLVINTLLGAVGIFSFWVKEKNLRTVSFFLMAFAAGTLLGGAFFHLFEESLEQGLESETVFLFALGGFVAFFIFENWLHWHRCAECKIHPYTFNILIGDGIHNLIDGIIVAITFLISVELGLAASIAILAHEIPQELGIFGVMVHGGQNKNKSLIYSVAAQSTSIIGGLLGYFFAPSLSPYVPLLLPLAAGGFIYISSSDLIPEIHKSERTQKIFGIVALFIGLLFMWILKGAH
ncbi:MAG: ZIP family metal transporter [Candidatus Anstonellales archaeon]